MHDDKFCITSRDLPGSQGNWKVTQRVLRGGLSDGVAVVEVDNGSMQLLVLPTRGMGIWRVNSRSAGTLGWQSPIRGPVHPQFVPITDSSGLGWLEGFDELVVRCGLESNGAPEFDDSGRLLYPLHGRIANRPAHFVEVTVDNSARTITLQGFVEETRFHFQKLRLEASLTTSFDSMSFAVSDTVENIGGTPAEMQMLYHINLGTPLLDSGAQLVAPIQSVEPRDESTPIESWELFGPPSAGTAEQCYFLKLLGDKTGRTKVLLRNAAATAGALIDYNTHTLPYFTLWKNMVAIEDGYVAGLEPATNFPNKRSHEVQKGRVVSLSPGENWSTSFELNWLTKQHEVTEAEYSIRTSGSYAY